MLTYTLLSTAHAQSAAFDLGSPFQVAGYANEHFNRIELIEGTYADVGAAWVDSSFELPAGGGFHATFEVSLDPGGFGGGLAFVLQGEGPWALGVDGGGLGYEGITPSLVVELDVWQSPGAYDPDDNHVGVNVDGAIASTATSPAPFDLNGVTTLYGRVDYVLGELAVSVDLVPPDGLSPLLTAPLPAPTGLLWVGFTASSGSGYDRTVWDFSFEADADSDGDGLLDFEDPEPSGDTGLPGQTDDDDDDDDDDEEDDDDDDDDDGETDGLFGDTGDPTDTDGTVTDTGRLPDGGQGDSSEQLIELPRVFFCGCNGGVGLAGAGPLPLVLLLVALRRKPPQRQTSAGA